MVQQLSLSASVSFTTLPVLASSLTALSSSTPTPIFLHHLNVKPYKEPNPDSSGTQSNDQYRLKITTSVFLNDYNRYMSLLEAAPQGTGVHTTGSEDKAERLRGLLEFKKEPFILALSSRNSQSSMDLKSAQDIYATSYFDDVELLKGNPWTLSASDIPAAGKRKVTSQAIMETHFEPQPSPLFPYAYPLKHGDEVLPDLLNPADLPAPTSRTFRYDNNVFSLLYNLGYALEMEYWVKGVRFYIPMAEGVTLIAEIFRVFVRDDDNVEKIPVEIRDEKFKGSEDRKPDASIQVSKLKLLDPDRPNYLLKVFANVQRSTDMESLNKVTTALETIQAELSELVSLGIPERNYMDSRVKK